MIQIKDLTQPQNYYWFENGFQKEELEELVNYIKIIPFEKGTVDGGSDSSSRVSSIKWVPFGSEYEWIYNKIINMAIEANDSLWKFTLHSAPEMIQYTEYYAEKGGHYDWHQDIGSSIMSNRKISVTVQLSDSDEYEGGDLEIWAGGDYIMKAPRGVGNVVIFPSYMMHRVTPVTKGTRKSFVLWLGGDHYR